MTETPVTHESAKTQTTALKLLQLLYLTTRLLQHALLVLLRLPNAKHTGAIPLRLLLHLLEPGELLELVVGRGHVLRARHQRHLVPDLLVVEVLEVDDGGLFGIRRRGRVLVLHGRAVQRRGLAGLLGEVYRQRRGAVLLICLLHAHRYRRVVVLQPRQAVAPEVARPLVAAVDLARVRQVQPGDGGEVFGCGGGGWEDGGTGSDADVEELETLLVGVCNCGVVCDGGGGGAAAAWSCMG